MESPIGPIFVVLLTTEQSQRRSTMVIWSTNPTASQLFHSNHSVEWTIDVSLGPFHSVEMARQCGIEIITGTRGKGAMSRKARRLSTFYNTRCYSGAPPVEMIGKELIHCEMKRRQKAGIVVGGSQFITQPLRSRL
jgi:hypothetical protein